MHELTVGGASAPAAAPSFIHGSPALELIQSVVSRRDGFAPSPSIVKRPRRARLQSPSERDLLWHKNMLSEPSGGQALQYSRVYMERIDQLRHEFDVIELSGLHITSRLKLAYVSSSPCSSEAAWLHRKGIDAHHIGGDATGNAVCGRLAKRLGGRCRHHTELLRSPEYYDLLIVMRYEGDDLSRLLSWVRPGGRVIVRSYQGDKERQYPASLPYDRAGLYLLSEHWGGASRAVARTTLYAR